MANVAIVGAGLSGLSAARAIERAGHHVTFFEKSRGVGGRAATRRHEGCHYDHGANYFKLTEAIRDLILHELPAEDLITIPDPVWTFGADGVLKPGDEAHNAEPRYGYREGINQLAKLLRATLDAKLLTQIRIQHLEHRSGGWDLVTMEGERHSGYDAVLLTPPGPQTLDVLHGSILPAALDAEALHAVWSGSAYQSQFSCTFGLNHRIPFPFSALLNTDRSHDIAWLQVEHAKEGHVPEEQSVLIVQMSPAWTAEHYEQDRDVTIATAWPITKQLIGIKQSQFLDWADVQRWRYALPTTAVDTDASAMAKSEAAGLFFASDAMIGKGRVEGVLELGAQVGGRLASWLGHS
ncbi:MAG: NAD(P)/FAD-dependent oxidoreductase [Rhodothermales bacterium]